MSGKRQGGYPEERCTKKRVKYRTDEYTFLEKFGTDEKADKDSDVRYSLVEDHLHWDQKCSAAFTFQFLLLNGYY